MALGAGAWAPQAVEAGRGKGLARGRVARVFGRRGGWLVGRPSGFPVKRDTRPFSWSRRERVRCRGRQRVQVPGAVKNGRIGLLHFRAINGVAEMTFGTGPILPLLARPGGALESWEPQFVARRRGRPVSLPPVDSVVEPRAEPVIALGAAPPSWSARDSGRGLSLWSGLSPLSGNNPVQEPQTPTRPPCPPPVGFGLVQVTADRVEFAVIPARPVGLLQVQHRDLIVCGEGLHLTAEPVPDPHEGRLCRPDNLTSRDGPMGGGREGDLPPSH